jgi:prefoldin subunit 4
MASKKDTVAIDVTWDDQRAICTFGRMHRRWNQLVDEISKKKQDLEKLSDASDEVYLCDSMKFVFGESFVTVDSNEADSLLTARKTKTEQELAKLQEEQQFLDGALKKVKAQLYAKFGSQVYLENE